MKVDKKLKGEKEICVRFKKNGKVEVNIYNSTGIIDEDGYERMEFKKTINSKLLEEIVKGY